MVNNKERKRIIDFLNNPIKKGLWESKFEWTENKGVFSGLFKQDELVKPQITPYNVLLILESLSKKKAGNLLIGGQLPSEIMTVIEKCNVSDYDEYISLYDNEVKSLNIGNNRIIINGGSTFVFQIPSYQNKYLKILSIDDNINKKIDKLFTSVKYGKIENTRKLYSPKDMLINPFFVFTDIVAQDLFEDYSQNEFFKSSYKSFLAQEYENSMSKIGKLCEYTLSEIYETLFREFVPEGSTIGNLHSLIYHKVKSKLGLPKEKIVRANFDELYNQARKLEKIDVISDKNLIETIRLASKLLKKEQEFNKYILNKNGEEASSLNIFPKYIAVYLKKILHYRNSVSHNSGIYFGYIDNLKMLFYYISLHTWWRTTYSRIVWESDEINIIKSIISKNKL